MIDSLSSSHRRTTKSITKRQTYQHILFSFLFYLGVVRRVLQLLLAGVVQRLDGTLNVQHAGIADVSPAPIQVFQPEHSAVAFLRVVVIPRSKLWGGVFSGADGAPLASIVLVVARHCWLAPLIKLVGLCRGWKRKLCWCCANFIYK